MINKDAYKKVALIILLLSFCFSLVNNVWFSGHRYLASNDTRLPINHEENGYYFYYLWSHSTAPGVFDTIKTTYIVPLGGILSIFDFLGINIDPSIFEKLLVTWLLFLSGISFYFLIGTLVPSSSRLVRFFGAFVYSFNFFSLYLWISLTFILFRYAAFPLMLAFYARSIRSEKGSSLKHAIFFSIAYTLLITPAYGTMPFIILDFSVLFLYLIFFVIGNSRNKSRISGAIKFSVSAMAVWILLNAFIIIPVISGFFDEISKISNSNVAMYDDPYALYLLNSSKVVDSIRLMGFWAFDGRSFGVPYYHWYHFYKEPAFILLSFIVPIISAMAFFSRRNKKEVVFFSMLLLLFIFLVKGEHDPLGMINKAIFSSFNLDSLFRSAYQRFVGYAALSLSVLFTIGLNVISEKNNEV